MEKTPLSLRIHISIFGNTNSGKSSLFNKLIGQNMSIVSNISGTTTDPVTKAMEIIGFGAVTVTDTAGWGDKTHIGSMRVEKTNDVLDKTDFAIYTADSTDFDLQAYESAKRMFEKKRIKHMLVFTKSDLCETDYSKQFPDSVSVSVDNDKSIAAFTEELARRLKKDVTEEKSIISELLPKGASVLLVIPIDSEAPKGRLILPQVQIIRDCLDNSVTVVCVRDTELADEMEKFGNVDLVVTDSQIFGKVSEIVPENIMLTSFSMLMAYGKGDINVLANGASALENLRDGSRILMAEACTHNSSHEDIGRVKIPKKLREFTCKNLLFDYGVYNDFPKNLSEYDLVIHCGGCMLNAGAMKNRIEMCRNAGVPITNYGAVLSYVNGILGRSMEIFNKKAR